MPLKTKPLSEQVALVTGGGTGIGRAFAEALSQGGARVCIASRREEVLKRTAKELNAPPRPGFIHVSNMARTLLYALSLDRDVVVEDIGLYAK